MPLFAWQKKTNEKGEEVLELPKEIQESIEKGAKAHDSLSRIETMLQEQKDLQAKKDDDEKKAREAAEAEKKRKEAAEKNGTLEEQIEALMLEGRTKDAIALATQGTNTAVLSIQADNVRREVFEDQEKFPYYQGDIKREVDALIASQPVTFRVNPANIQNCYDTVMGKHVNEIVEGKLKKRFASASGAAEPGKTGGGSTDDGPKGKVDAEIEKMAKQFGMTGAEYAKMLDAEGIGY